MSAPACFRLPALLLVIAVLCACFGAGVAGGDAIAPYPGIAYPGGAYDSRCAAITLGPQVVEVGHDITLHAGPPTDECDSKPEDLTWNWSVPGDVVSGCKPTGSSCVVKEVQPTDLSTPGTYSWSQACIDGNSGFGGWSSCALFVVLDRQYEVSGTVTETGTDAGIPNVQVKADCPHGGTATTNASGMYAFALDRGSCTIKVLPPSDESATPASRVVEVDRDIQNVNFQMGCGGGGAGADIARAAAAGGNDCRLDVKIKKQGPGTTGLGWLAGTGGDGAQGEFVATPATDAPFGDCLSGCENITVTVTDHKTGKAPDGGASVSVGVTPIPTSKVAPYPKGFQADQGHICLLSNPSDCGTTLQDLPTASNGVLNLIYWAPGVIDDDTVKLTVTAEDACSTSVCHTSRQFGKAHTSIHLIPQKIIDTAGKPLGPDETTALVDWAEEDGDIKFKEDGDGEVRQTAVESVLHTALDYGAEAFEIEIPGGFVLVTGQMLNSIRPKLEPLTTRLGQEQAVTSLFAEPFGLHTDGLGAVDALALDRRFVDAIANQNGLMRKFAEFVRDEREHKGGGHEYNTHLTVDEVSYCETETVCGPGASTPGVQPFLYILFQATGPSTSNHNETHFEGSVVVPYYAALFDVAQFGGQPPTLLH